MSLTDDLQRLAELHERGALSADEFQQAKAKLLAQPTASSGSAGSDLAQLDKLDQLRRSREDRWLGGVCGGLARAVGIETWVCRLCFAILTLLWGTGLLIYLLLWVFVPNETA